MNEVTKEVLTLKSLTWSSHGKEECGNPSLGTNNEDNGNLGEEEERQSERERERGIDGKEWWDVWFEHPHMQWTHKSKHLGSLLASLPPAPRPPPPPIPPQPTARAVGFYLSCVQAQASVKRAEESAGASALSSGRETRASITCNIELLGHFCASDPQQMEGETARGRLSSNTLAHPSHLPWKGVLRIKEKSGLRFLVENMAKSLSEVQSPVSRNSWREAHLI